MSEDWESGEYEIEILEDEVGDLFFEMEDVHRMNHKRTEIELLQANIAISTLKEALAKLEVTVRIHGFHQDRTKLAAELKSREARLRGLSREIGTKYDVDMESIVYDDQTGKVSPI